MTDSIFGRCLLLTYIYFRSKAEISIQSKYGSHDSYKIRQAHENRNIILAHNFLFLFFFFYTFNFAHALFSVKEKPREHTRSSTHFFCFQRVIEHWQIVCNLSKFTVCVCAANEQILPLFSFWFVKFVEKNFWILHQVAKTMICGVVAQCISAPEPMT